MLPPWMLAEGTGGGTGGTALVLPSLLLAIPDAGPLPAGLTVTRATHKQQEYPAGTVTDKGNDVASLEAGGLAIEAAHTNRVGQSHAVGFAPWVVRGSATATLNAAVAPDGATTASHVHVGAFGAADVYEGVPGFSVGAVAPSFWLKKITGTGTINVQDPFAGLGNWNVNLALVGAGWERITSTHPAVTVVTPFTTTGGNNGMLFSAASGTLDFYLWGVQSEDGAYPHSYVPTTTAAVTCNLDAVAGSAGQIAALPVAAGRVAVTFTPEWSTANSPTTAALLDTRSATPNNGFALTVAANKLTWIGEAGTPLQSAALTWVAGTQYTVMAVWNGTTVTLYQNGTSVASGASTQPAGQTALKIGRLYDSSAPLDGHVASVAFFRG